MQPNNASPLSPPVLGQSTGSAQEQSPGLAQLTGAQEVEPHQHNNAGGRRYSCKSCVKIFKRPQELLRHTREVHDSVSRKCPLCPPDWRPWKRPSLLRNHLINDHHKEFGEDDFERILVLKGKDVFEFVDAVKPSQLQMYRLMRG